MGERFKARIINYADDFVICSRGHARAAMEWTAKTMGRLGLTLNATKTCVRDAWAETFDFLGYTFGAQVHHKFGGRVMEARPSRKSIARVKRKLHDVLRPWNTGAWPEVADRVNRVVVGWSNYFSHGAVYCAYRAVDNHLYDRVRHFLRRRHKVKSGGTSLLPTGKSLRAWGVVRLLDVMRRRRQACASG